jgi:hypothetical protein
VVQDTGFGCALPTGQGLFAFSDLDDAVQALQTIAADYSSHARAAREIAEEYLDAGIVLTQLLEAAASSAPLRTPVRSY